ncbi:hypothetical protein [Bacillus sp. JCM 19041]|uniref:hypothetical protein n=1 Tax=Bacillus sp. JCM 19041 TaxID=1460637 RepID=UPI000A957D7E
MLKARGVDFVFVLGHPEYYPSHGFKPAIPFGLQAPYLNKDEHGDAWMVKALSTGTLDRYQGSVFCSHSLNKPEHWRE